jgi:hypothetical protein
MKGRLSCLRQLQRERSDGSKGISQKIDSWSSLVIEHAFAQMLMKEMAIDGLFFVAHRERYAQ